MSLGLLVVLAAPAQAEDEPYFYTDVNFGMTVTAMPQGQAVFPYVVVHKGLAQVDCYLRVYETKGPNLILVKEVPIGTQTGLPTFCGSVAPFSYTWTGVDLVPGGYRCKLAATDGTQWALDDLWCYFNVTTTPDTTAPVTSNDYDGFWHADTLYVHLNASDPAPSWGLQGGASRTEYSIDGGATWTRGSTATFRVRRRGIGSGVYTLLYRSTDYAGNAEAAKSVEVLVDGRPPHTTDDAPLVPQAGDVTVRLTAADDLRGVTACSGVKETLYSLDGGNWTRGTQVTIRAAGHAGGHTIAYYSIDNAGNVELARSCSVTIAAASASGHAARRRALL